FLQGPCRSRRRLTGPVVTSAVAAPMNPPPRAGRTRMIRERTAVGVDLNPTSKRTNITSAGALRPSSAWPTARNARSMFKILAGGVFDAALVLDARVDEQPIFSPPRPRRIRARQLPRDRPARSF